MTFITDIRHAVRSLRRTSGFALAAVATLALGITLCTTALAAANAYLLQGLPYPAAERLFWLRYGAPGQDAPRGMEALDWASLDDVIEHPIAWDLDIFYLLGGDRTESAAGAWVTRGFVEGLGIRPALGRGFDPRAFEPGGENVAIISHRLWVSRFAGDPGIVGTRFTAYVSDRPEEAEGFTIVGVLPQDFWHLNAYTDVIAPLRAPAYPYMARLRAGVAPAEAQARVTALVRSGARDVPDGWEAQVVSTHDAYVAGMRPMLRTVAAAAALVFLVACANVAGLMLVRATRRQKEMAVRAALGAGRGAIVRMLFAESVVLAGLAAIVALFFTDSLLAVLGPAIEQRLGRLAPGGATAFAFDARMAGIAAVLALFAGAVCTLASLPGALRRSQSASTPGASRTATEGRHSGRIRTALIAVEIAASLALLAGSTLMIRTVSSLVRVDLGIDAERVIYGSVTLRQSRYPEAGARAALFERMIRELEAVPGAEAVGLTSIWPLQEPRLRPVTGEGASAQAGVHIVGGDYFATLGIPLSGGRAFAATDVHGGELVAIVSESLARRLWPDGQAIGQRLLVEEAPGGDAVTVARRVVGVARDVRQGPADEDLADVYVPMAQAPGRFAFAMMRTAGPAPDRVAPFAAAFRAIDPEIAVDRVTPMQAVADRLTAQPRFLTALLAGFAGSAALLALVGVYGVIAYAVRQREREIAVRIAIGADPARVTALFVRQGAKILAAGLALGTLGALAGARLIESQLFGVTPRDPAALSAAVGLFALAGLAAIWWPSRRAARTDPAIALRTE